MTPVARYATPAMGLIVLRVDETIEHEFRQFIPPNSARLHVTRIDSGDDLTPDSIGRMEARLTDSASLLPAAAGFDVVAYACTSGTALLGAETVERLIRAGIPCKTVTNPLTAALAQMQDRGVRRVGIVSPYVATVAEVLTHAFEAGGLTVAGSLSLNESDEASVARISPDITANAARDLAQRSDVDCIFLSCTNLNTADILDGLETELGMPVLSSNHALAWHMQRLCGLV